MKIGGRQQRYDRCRQVDKEQLGTSCLELGMSTVGMQVVWALTV